MSKKAPGLLKRLVAKPNLFRRKVSIALTGNPSLRLKTTTHKTLKIMLESVLNYNFYYLGFLSGLFGDMLGLF